MFLADLPRCSFANAREFVTNVPPKLRARMKLLRSTQNSFRPAAIRLFNILFTFILLISILTSTRLNHQSVWRVSYRTVMSVVRKIGDVWYLICHAAELSKCAQEEKEFEGTLFVI